MFFDILCCLDVSLFYVDSARDARIGVLTASLEESQRTAAAEAEARSELQQQLDVASNLANAAAAEAGTREIAAAAENEKLRMLLIDATREVQAAFEGMQYVNSLCLFKKCVSFDFELYLHTKCIVIMCYSHGCCSQIVCNSCRHSHTRDVFSESP
jgi:hypothetical protein